MLMRDVFCEIPHADLDLFLLDVAEQAAQVWADEHTGNQAMAALVAQARSGNPGEAEAAVSRVMSPDYDLPTQRSAYQAGHAVSCALAHLSRRRDNGWWDASDCLDRARRAGIDISWAALAGLAAVPEDQRDLWAALVEDWTGTPSELTAACAALTVGADR